MPTEQAQGERRVLVDELLALLTDIERQIFLLRIMQNLPHREIAKIVNLPLGTSLWHFSRAMKKSEQKGSENHANQR